MASTCPRWSKGATPLTQKELSRLTGIPQSDISKIINDRKAIYLTTAQKIAKALGSRVDHIWPYY
ncbi:MAG: helix-turn-helix domain-containing protein [Desulfitobacteriaceae bacterium]